MGACEPARSLQVEGDLTDLHDIRQVTYHLHPTFPNPDRVIRSSPESGFRLTTRGWGTFRVRATVEFADGSTKPLEHHLRFTAPRDDDLALVNTSRYVGPDDAGTPRWDWTASVTGPRGAMERVTRVTYHLHPTFRPSERTIDTGAAYGFPLSTNGWGTFTLGATVHFDDGSTRELQHELEFEVGTAKTLEKDGSPEIVAPVKK